MSQYVSEPFGLLRGARSAAQTITREQGVGAAAPTWSARGRIPSLLLGLPAEPPRVAPARDPPLDELDQTPFSQAAARCQIRSRDLTP